MDGNLVLQLDSIVKTFPGVKALDGVKLDVIPGEIHALCGENGAGKSTLMKIISGAQSYTSGKMFVEGEEVVFNSTKDAEAKGISMIYQEFNLISDISVAENIYLGRWPKTSYGKIDWDKLYKDAQEDLEKLGLKFNSKDKVKSLSVAECQMVEIAKCLTIGAKVIIMDEPTAALTDEEIKVLFEIIADLKSQGIAILYISHRMDEIFEISDRLTVFRDGKYIATKDIEDTDYDDVVSMMVGQSIKDLYPKRDYKQKDVVLDIRNITSKTVKDLSLKLHKGEILGIAGLLGSGNIELAKVLSGVLPMQEGEVYINGNLTDCSTPIRASRGGIGFVTDDRKQEGLVLVRDVKENISLSSLRELRNGIRLDKKLEMKKVNRQVEQLNIKISNVQQEVKNLSGGNQQKVVFAKVLETDPDILILAEPTRGVDVGAKAEIYTIMNELTESGKSIIIITSDLPELIGMSDRVVTMKDGEIVMEAMKVDTDEEEILAYASGGVE